MKKEYESPVIYIEEYELESALGNLCSSSIDPIPYSFYNGGQME